MLSERFRQKRNIGDARASRMKPHCRAIWNVVRLGLCDFRAVTPGDSFFTPPWACLVVVSPVLDGGSPRSYHQKSLRALTTASARVIIATSRAAVIYEAAARYAARGRTVAIIETTALGAAEWRAYVASTATTAELVEA